MRVMVLGSTGATGKHVVNHLLEQGHLVTTLVRNGQGAAVDPNLTELTGTALDMNFVDLVSQISDCDAVVSCLGHNLSFKGVYGGPRNWLQLTIEKLVKAIEEIQSTSDKKVKLILMGSSGVSVNQEITSLAQRSVVFLLRHLLPPHKDNELAAQTLLNADSNIEWSIVRPDGLVNETKISLYQVFASPIRSAIFNAGQVSRINVADFMVQLATDETLWQQWKGQCPVLYSEQSVKETALNQNGEVA